MKRLSPKLWAVPLALLVWGAADVAGLLCSAACAQQTYPTKDESWGSSISSDVKSGFGKIGKALNPKPSPRTSDEDDAVSLNSKAKPGPNLYVAIARLYMQNDKPNDAEQQFQLALKEKPDFLPALLGYAELKEQTGQPDAAIRLYERAARIYPQEASIYNNMGLCYARQSRLDEAVPAMTRAIQLAPTNARYRNNIATMLVDQGNLREAYDQLRQVHDEAASYYNLGYLLNKKGQTRAAIQHFSLALRADPSMLPAQQWIQHLEKTTTQARLPQHPAAGGLRITSDTVSSDGPRDSTSGGLDSPPNRPERTPMPQPTTPTEEVQPSLPEAPMPQSPRRLPPVSSREPESDGPSLPGISYNGYERPSAPLPPPATNSAVRHLPRVN